MGLDEKHTMNVGIIAKWRAFLCLEQMHSVLVTTTTKMILAKHSQEDVWAD